MPTNSPITLRLDVEAVEQLKVVATVQGRTINDLLRDAVSGYLTTVTSEPDFVKKLDESLNRMREAVRPPVKGSARQAASR